MNHGGLKNVATEPTRLENKRERRRGAAGRAAALRRAPSDSDCSGETASLSADSGDRAPRPPPQPPRSGKTRSRRRGSEWEVLEGLKDGQRFEKRPDVFNGYLHKKRKWPLKGWHKRFFVVDGGILVYARSPTDVARGRLHGSVDVGLSVISAKARRRRIDIDADEFIYHLRAKTPDVFRTWLNVLKAHRLYRQHLLTFGARESVPKIHAPLDDLPPTDTSSRTTTHTSSTSSSSEESQSIDHKPKSTNKNESYDYRNKVFKSKTNLKTVEDNVNFNNTTMYKNNSLCSMNCISRRFDKQDLKRRKSPIPIRQKSPNISLGSTDAEKHMMSTDLEGISLRSTDPEVTATLDPINQMNVLNSKSNLDKQKLFFDKLQATHAYYFFTRKKNRCASPDAQMKRSKKSTNLVKYRNFLTEPILKKPLSRCMLLKNCDMKSCRAINMTSPRKPVGSRVFLSGKASNEVQVACCDTETITKSSLDAVTMSECDNITQKLMISLFQNKFSEKSNETKQYLKQVVRELYDVNISSDPHPIRELFRGLLDYWLTNNSKQSIQNRKTQSQSIDRQSNKHFTKDQNVSSFSINTVNRQTQFHGISDVFMQFKHRKVNSSTRRLSRVTETQKKVPPTQSPKRDTESFEKERRIQELERILKNTVYMVDTSGNSKNKEKDIKITKTLIDNIGKLSRRSDISKSSDQPKKDNSNSSTEKMQETINHLISDVSIPADVAKEFLSAYLDVLLHGDSSMTNTSSQSSSPSIPCKTDPKCEVQTEAITKKVSKSVTNVKRDCDKPNMDIDPGQLYLKDILDKVTTIFSRVTKIEEKSWDSDKSQNEMVGDGKPEKSKDKVGIPVKEYPGKTLIYENIDENSVVIDLTKYNLEHVSVASDPNSKGLMTITIKLKEKADMSDIKRTQLELKFSESRRMNDLEKDDWLDYISPNDTNSNVLFNKKDPKRTSYLDFPTEFDLKPYLSSSDVTTKAYQVTHESEHTIDLSFNSSNAFHKDFYENEDEQSCYIMSFKNGALATKFQSKKKVKVKECNGVVTAPENDSNRVLPRKPSELCVFERPAPRVIDEKFILLLLENLTLLSKDIPSLHKEINALYIKLKKKHEKIVKTCGNIQGVSLLGKIYDSCTSHFKEIATQWEEPYATNKCVTKEVSISTSVEIIPDKPRVTHQSLSVLNLRVILNSTAQTSEQIEPKVPEIVPKAPKNQSSDILEPVITRGKCITIERATSNPNWTRQPTRERAVSTIIKCILDANTTHNHNFYVESKDRKKNIHRKEAFLPPQSKVSTQSQTDKKIIRICRDNRSAEREFKIYQLFVSRGFSDLKSNSMSDNKLSTQLSDDLKTLYRCNSDPSIVSG